MFFAAGRVSLRARVLEENVAGFYDERPSKRRLYAVSEDRTFSPMNQIVLAHELRHALQDQYQTLDSYLDKDISAQHQPGSGTGRHDTTSGRTATPLEAR